MKKIYKTLLIILGWILVALGFIGIFLPLMPTTIFLVLAAACFARSSDKFYNWLINHPRFGSFIKNYREHRGMPRKAKVIAVTMVILTIGSSALFFTQNIYIRSLLFVIAIGIITYLLSLKTIPDGISE
jgi:uncharacterized membrane protein YbaN (DUF454 family)